MLIYFPVAFFVIHEGVSSSIVVACVTQQTGLAFEARSSLRRAGAVLCFAFVPQQFFVLFCLFLSKALSFCYLLRLVRILCLQVTVVPLCAYTAVLSV